MWNNTLFWKKNCFNQVIEIKWLINLVNDESYKKNLIFDLYKPWGMPRL